MKTGRPRSDDYDRVAFVKTILEQARASEISMTALGKRSLIHGRNNKLVPINKGTISGIVHGDRHATREEREAIMRTLKLEPDFAAQFIGTSSRGRYSKEIISDYNYPRPPLVEAVKLLVRGFYPDAYRKLRQTFDSAMAANDLVLQADACARLAWLYLEIGDFPRAAPWADRGIAIAACIIGLPVARIIQSAGPIGVRSSSSKTAVAARILSDAMHLRSQILVGQMLYLDEWEPEQAARLSLEEGLALDRRLGFAEPVGNDLGWKAVMSVSGKKPDLKVALRLLDECAGQFAPGSLYEAHLVKTQGIVHLRGRRSVHGRDLLVDARDRLSSFADSRGLALALYVLSDFLFLHSTNKGEPFRYLLAAGALHPYGFLLERCRSAARSVGSPELQGEIDKLFAGINEYRVVHRMMERLAQDSGHTGEDLLYRNVRLMVGRDFPNLTIPGQDGKSVAFQKR